MEYCYNCDKEIEKNDNCYKRRGLYNTQIGRKEDDVYFCSLECVLDFYGIEETEY